ncbi:MAG: hypothetical protein HC896_04835 [Bacteroidales bacterium]|nr:hypothetical protein [Bacteroidales bacterium]
MIGIAGLSHKTAPLKIREKFSFSAEEARGFSNAICNCEGFQEIFVLSTCNRTEFCFFSDGLSKEGCKELMYTRLSEFLQIPIADFSTYFYFNMAPMP